MRVGGEPGGWAEGKCFVFDDMTEHEVWNRGTSERVVLLVDFASEEKLKALTGPLRLAPEIVAMIKRLDGQFSDGASDTGRQWDLSKIV